MKPRKRFIIVLIIVAAIAAFCSSRVYSQERAKPRGQGGAQAQGERKRSGPPPEARQPRAGRQQQGERSQDRARRNDGDARRPPQNVPPPDRNRSQDRNRYGDAQRRHPQPDGRFDRGLRQNEWDRYHWRNWRHRGPRDRDRFPRFYFGLRLFDGFRYRGHPFGPHYRLWYYDGYWRMCYWPFPYAPQFGCGWYWVPTDRRLVYDPETDEEYWDYSDYRYVYLCID